MTAKSLRPQFPEELLLRGSWKRFLQLIALFVPGQTTWRVRLHRWRGVHIGEFVHIGTAVMIETAFPEWVSIGNNVVIGMRATLIAHFEGNPPPLEQLKDNISIRIEDEAFVGPCSLIMPNVTIGRGAVITAGSVVTRSVPPMTMVQGNPARPIAKCGIPLTFRTPLKEFLLQIKPIRSARGESAQADDGGVPSDPHKIPNPAI